MRTARLAVALLVFVSTVLAGEPPALPVIEVPATGRSSPEAPLMIFMTGDGGWAEFVREISKRLAGDGWSVVGFNLRKYLSTPRTPEETAAAVDSLVARYGAQWQRSRIVIGGFSRGADLSPFVFNRLSPATRQRVALVVLLSPGAHAEFEFHVADFLRKPPASALRPVAEEIVGMGDEPILVLHGEKDEEALVLPAAPGRIIKLPGDHHLNRDFATIVKLIEAAEHGAVKAAAKR